MKNKNVRRVVILAAFVSLALFALLSTIYWRTLFGFEKDAKEHYYAALNFSISLLYESYDEAWSNLVAFHQDRASKSNDEDLSRLLTSFWVSVGRSSNPAPQIHLDDVANALLADEGFRATAYGSLSWALDSATSKAIDIDPLPILAVSRILFRDYPDVLGSVYAKMLGHKGEQGSNDKRTKDLRSIVDDLERSNVLEDELRDALLANGFLYLEDYKATHEIAQKYSEKTLDSPVSLNVQLILAAYLKVRAISDGSEAARQEYQELVDTGFLTDPALLDKLRPVYGMNN